MVTRQQIEDAAIIIRTGGLVAFPTETVYGLGANALNPNAVAKIFIEKERPSFDPLIVHICNKNDLTLLCKDVDERVLMIIEEFWPGPLTIVLPKSHLVPDIVTSGLQTVAVRMPNNAIALQLIEASGCPIAAPSANKFGKLSPTTAAHVKKQLPSVSCILDGGSTAVGIESTVISINQHGFEILRQGIITQQDLERILPYSKSASHDEILSASPGLLKSHYSPNKPLYILGESNPIKSTLNAAFLSFTGKNTSAYKVVEYLTRSEDLNEAAVNLFGALHRLEENAEIDMIIAEPVPEYGIGLAIMDRLRKAAFRYS